MDRDKAPKCVPYFHVVINNDDRIGDLAILYYRNISPNTIIETHNGE